MGASAIVGGVGRPALARAADVLVLGRDGRVTVRGEPLPPLPPPPTPPSATSAAAPAHGRRAGRSAAAPPISAQLARLERLHLISPAAYRDYVGGLDAALAAAARLHGTRAVELRAVIANLREIAATGLLSASRLPALFLTLRRNVQWWTSGPIPAPGQIVSFAGSQIDWEYYVGQGLELQVLGSFGKASWFFTHGARYYAQGRSLLAELIPLASHRAGGLTWEYYFRFDGGTPPWTSAISQGTALAALANGYGAVGDPQYLAVAARALPVFRVRPPNGVAVRTSRGIRFVMYSFDPARRDEVINGFLQALIGLSDYARVSGNRVAAHLFAAGSAEAEHELPYYDTGSWSLYQPGVLDTVSYHELVTGFVQRLCSITRAPVYCTTAARFRAELNHPPPGVAP